MDYTSRIALFVMIFAVSLLISYLFAEAQKTHVRRSLTDAGCTPVSISWRFFGGNRGSFTYDVVYLDRNGMEQTTSCKVNSGVIFGGNDVYWKQSPR